MSSVDRADTMSAMTTPPTPPTPPFSRNNSVDTNGSHLSTQMTALTFARTSSLPGGDVTAWLREKFPELPPDDFCDTSYSCALFRAILLQGRMYVTCSGLAFYAKIFGRVTKEYIPFSRVRCVRKRGAGLLANAIKVEFHDEGVAPVVFGSLNRRERALALITLKLCAANPLALRAAQVEDDESGSWEGDEHADAHADAFRSKSVPASHIAAGRAQRNDMEGGGDGDGEAPLSFVMDGLERACTEGKLCHKSSKGVCDEQNHERQRALTSGSLHLSGKQVLAARTSSVGALSAGSGRGGLRPVRKSAKMPPKGMWKVGGDVVDRIHGNAYGSKIEQARRVLHAPVERVFDLLFSGSWMLEVNQKNGNTEVTETPWAREDGGFMTRTLTFNRALGYRIGPKTTRVVETQRYSFTGTGGAVFETCGRNLDVPLGDSFLVEGYLELSPANAGRATTIVASVAVHFTKSSMLRSKIESGAISETKATYTRLLDLAELKVNAEAADDATLPPANERSDSSLNKRSSDNLAKMQYTVPDSPTKKHRHERSPSDTSSVDAAWKGSPILAGLQIPPLQATQATLPPSEGIVSASRVTAADPDPLRQAVVVLLAVIALLLLLCVMNLSKLQADVLRLEKLVVLAVEKADGLGSSKVCPLG